jgi:hypothetical protein
MFMDAISCIQDVAYNMLHATYNMQHAGSWTDKKKL